MGTVQQAAQEGAYALGVERFRALEQPSATDLRWAGVCLMHVEQYPEASLRLQQAFAQGVSAAAIHLASLRFLQGDPSLAVTALDQVSPDNLDAADAALWYRERARLLWVLGEPREVLYNSAHQAWSLATEAPVDVQVSVATLLGKLHGHFGDHVAALAFLDFAAECGNPQRLEYVNLSRVASLIPLGRLEEAEQALTGSKIGRTGLLRAVLEIEVLCAREAWTDARAALLELLPNVQGHGRIELRVRLWLLALATFEGDDSQAQIHISRAEYLTKSRYDRALLDHRAGFWQFRHGDAQGLKRLVNARKVLEVGGHLYQLVSLNLALAEADSSQRDYYIYSAAKAMAALSSPPLLNTEWPLMPEVYHHILMMPVGNFERDVLMGRARTPTLYLRTLGQAKVEIGGTPVRLRLARTVELLAYLYRRDEADLLQIQRDLFPDTPPLRAKNYFHQVRVEVASRIPELEISYNTQRRIYSLRGKDSLRWDVIDLECSLSKAILPDLSIDHIDFLPTAESEWAQQEREQLKRWVVQVGVETMEQLYQVGHYHECVKIGGRLFLLDPLDEIIHILVINSIFQTRGHSSARRAYKESAEIFIRDVGEIPDRLRSLETQW